MNPVKRLLLGSGRISDALRGELAAEDRGKHIDVPLRGGRPAGIEVRAEPARIVFAYDPGLFHADRSGLVEVHLKTPSAVDLAARLA